MGEKGAKRHRCAAGTTARGVFCFNIFNLFNLCTLCTAVIRYTRELGTGRLTLPGTLQRMRTVRSTPQTGTLHAQDVRLRKWYITMDGLLIVQRRATVQRTTMVHPDLDTLSPLCYYHAVTPLYLSHPRRNLPSFLKKGKSNAINPSTKRFFFILNPFR